MHVLVTADTVGGVWTYTRELVTGLTKHGVQVTLVSFGGIPDRSQSAWLEELHGVAYFPTGFRLEWMPDAERDIRDSMSYLRSIIHERRPDLLHLSQYCYGALDGLDAALPKLVVAHSDVMSWSRTVRGAEPEGHWAEWYRATVAQGLAGASLLVAPSRWMLECLESCYGPQRYARVVYNGRTPFLFNPFVSKRSYAASAGRLWDDGKQAQLLMQLTAPPLPIFLAGATALAGEGGEAAQERAKSEDHRALPGEEPARESGVQLRGQLSEREMRELLSRASIYVAASIYEPFGLAPLEAALSRCAIIANDIPSFHEIWDDAALYFRSNDAASLQESLVLLYGNRELRAAYANRAYERARLRYTAVRMVEDYMQLYRALLEHRVLAA